MKLYTSIFIIHVCIILSMFDVYFQTNLITGINPVKSYTRPYTNRLVLFVGDGLRSDTFFGPSGKIPDAPFIRSKMTEGASWGVSHTRVPTESRPGHVAIIAGFYEDPSAVFQGWKKNSVPFDSVFNQSVATFSWGSPDIVPMFSNENSNKNIFYYNYNEEDQDLSGKNGSVEYLNSWVYNKFQEMYNNISNDSVKYDLWNKSGIIFFFHFLGIDAAGHAFNPNTDGYINSLRQTDEIIRNITFMIENYYKNNDTTYIFTSDHGMTDWGSHGAGSSSETETPLVAWGSGINRTNCLNGFDPQSSCSKNVSQADIAVLMSVLLGQSIPIQSIGVLPVDYLDIPDKDKCQALLMNANQLIEQYLGKESAINNSMADVLFTPFDKLLKGVIEFYIKNISLNIDSGNYEVALNKTKELINLVIEGTKYYDRYFQSIKLSLVAFTIIGVIACILSEIIPFLIVKGFPEGERIVGYLVIRKFNVRMFYTFICFSLAFYLILSRFSILPQIFFFYLGLPVPFWLYSLSNSKWIWKLWRIIEHANFKKCFEFMLYAISLSLLFYSFYYRWMLTVLMIVIMLWPLIRMRVDEPIKTLWIISALLVGIFPLLPTVGSQPNINFVIASASLLFIIGFSWSIITLTNMTNFTLNKKILVQTILIIPVLLNIYAIDEQFSSGKGLSSFNQIVSYTFLLANFLMLFFNTSPFLLPRFLSMTLSSAMMFLQFCSKFEAFFPIALAFHLVIWIFLEISATTSTRYIIYSTIPEIEINRLAIKTRSIRQSFFFLFYIVMSYFGIGNIESISSFDLAWVRGFVTVFSPFLMTTLILLKVIIPFVMVTFAFRILVIKTQTNVSQLFYIVLIFCDILGFLFLVNVKNEGSWLEIGESISRFIIIETTVLFLLLIYGFTSLIIRTNMNNSYLPYNKRHYF